MITNRAVIGINDLIEKLKEKAREVKPYLPACWYIASTIPRAIFGNPEFLLARFNGHINHHLPHVYSGTPLGFLHFTAKEAALFTKIANQTQYGIATCYIGPFLTYYVTTLEMREKLVLESKVGFVTDVDHKIMDLFSNGNKVHRSFTDFLPIKSKIYKDQRHFLFKNFHKNVSHHLYGLLNRTENFLKDYHKKYGQKPILLREFITALVLNISTPMLGIDSECKLDQEYLTNPVFRDIVNHVAQYGISERSDPIFEEKIYQCFLEILCKNYHNIVWSGNKDNNLIQAIFDSLNPHIPFPRTFSDFMRLSKEDKHAIAMSFASIGLGGMVHSTVNTLDWNEARLYNNSDKLKELTEVMIKYRDEDLSDPRIFDKGKGGLFPMTEWILDNVHRYPPFSHQVFLNRQGLRQQLLLRKG